MATSGLSYTLSDDSTYYICSGIGTATDTDIVIASEYNGKPVKEIGASAFKSTSSTGSTITSVTIPDSVTTIGSSAFYWCNKLTSIEIPNSVTSIGSHAFMQCTKVTSIVVGNGVTSIEDYTFNKCTSLTNITFGSAITSIGAYVFMGSTAVVEYNFEKATTVPTLSNTNSFYNINSNAKIVVPNSLYEEWIVAENWSTFASYIVKRARFVLINGGGGTCPTLYAPTIYYLVSSGILNIDDAVNGNHSTSYDLYVDDVYIANITDKQSLLSNYIELSAQSKAVKVIAKGTNFNNSTFSNILECTSGAGTEGLEYTLSDDGTYYACSGLGTATETDIVIASVYEGLPVTRVGGLGSADYTYKGELTSIVIPEGVTRLESYCCANNPVLTRISLPKSLTYIGNASWSNNNKMKEVYYGGTINDWASNITFGSGSNSYSATPFYEAEELYINNELVTEANIDVTKINANAFYKMNCLESVILSENVTSIGDNAFRYCSTCLTFDFSTHTTVPTLGTNAFYNINSNAKIVVPDSLYDTWIASTNWSDYASYIVKASEYTG